MEQKRSGLVSAQAIHADDLAILRRQLYKISQVHYEALWAEEGPMSKALRGQFIGKQQFERHRPDIMLIHQQGTLTQNLCQFTRAFAEANIDEQPLNLSNMQQSQIDALSELLTFIIDSLIDIMRNYFQGKDSDILSAEQSILLKEYLQTLIPKDTSTLSKKAWANIFIQFIDKIWNLTDESQQEQFFSGLIEQRPDLFTCFDFEKIRYSSIRTAIELRTEGEPTFAYKQLAKLFDGEIDDFCLFNEAYGFAFTTVDDSQENFSIHDTPYQVHNGVIKSVSLAISDQNNLGAHTFASRWEGLVNLTNATTVFNKNINPDRGDNTYPIRSLSAIYNWLLNLKEPLLRLQSHTDCTAIIDNITSLHEKSFDEVYKFLYFNSNHQGILATYFNLSLPNDSQDYRNFLAQLTSRKHLATLAPHKKHFAEIIRDFAIGKLTHVGFQAELKKFKVHYVRPTRFIDRLKNYVVAIFTPGWGNFSALLKQYDDILGFNRIIRPSFKQTREQVDIILAKESVSAKFELQGRSQPEVSVQSVKSQDKDKIGDLVWLRKSISCQIDQIKSSLLGLIQHSEQRKTLEEAAAKKSNPAYANAFSRLLFLSQNTSSATPTLPVLEDRLPQLTSLVGQTIDAHKKIHDAPASSNPKLPATSTTTQKQLTQTFIDLQRLNRKTEVRAHLMNELLVDTRPVVSVF